MRGAGLAAAALRGGLAGLIGGLAYGAALAQLGALPGIAGLVGSGAPLVGLLVHLVISALVGAGFGLLAWHLRPSAGETLFWGLAYATVWWFLGPLTLLPLLLGGGSAWDAMAAQAQFPALLGHLLYGAVTALAFVALGRPDAGAIWPRRGALLRGALAGLFCGWLLGLLLDAQGQLTPLAGMMGGSSERLAWAVTLGVAVVAGLLYGWLYPRVTESTGAGLVRGSVYGFLWWVLGELTVLPLLGGQGLAWSVEAARNGFAGLIGYVLFGAGVALVYQWLDGLVRLLFSDVRPARDEEGVGTQGLRALGRGALAGLVGGLLFTIVMVEVGFLSTVASLIGSDSMVAGFVVHLVISNLIGASYGVLFRRQSYDLGSAVGWGVSYGFFWWFLGPLTILPLLLGFPPRWTVEVAAGLTASLVGHLAYGAGLGMVFYWLEARQNPWWVPRTRAEGERVARRKEQLVTSAPALWALVVAISLTLPVILAAGQPGSSSGGYGGYSPERAAPPRQSGGYGGYGR